jgi:hypothetical protein
MKKMIFLLCLVFIFQSCTQDLQRDSELGSIENTTISFGLKLPVSSTPDTRSGVAIDNRIEDITVFVFDGTSKKGLYSRTGTITTKPDGAIEFTTNLIARESSVIIHVFANVGSALAGQDISDLSEETIIKNLTLSDNLGTVTALPMHGILELSKVDNTVATGETVFLLRSVARVDVVSSSANFTLQATTCYFTPSKGRLVHHSAYWNPDGNEGHGEVTAPTMPTSDVTKIKTNTATGVAVNTISNQLFVYENTNAAGVGNSTRLVVKGAYNDGATTTSYWYPVDFIKAGVLTNVLRNYKYTFNITSVTGPGYDSEIEASEGVATNIKVEIIDWSHGGGDIDFLGPNWFSIQSKSIVLLGDRGVEGSLSVKSNIPVNKWEMRWGAVGEYSSAESLPTNLFTVSRPASGYEGSLNFMTRFDYAEITPPYSEKLYLRIDKTLQIIIDVSQIKVEDIIEVDGNRTNFTAPLMYHEGGLTKDFHVVTGNDLVSWSAMTTSGLSNILYPHGGQNNSDLKISFLPNETAATIVRTIEVARQGGSNASLIMTCNQEDKPVFNNIVKKAFTAGEKAFTMMLDSDYNNLYEWTAKLTFTGRNPENNEITNLPDEKIFQLQRSTTASEAGLQGAPGFEVSGTGGNYLMVHSPARTEDDDEGEYTATLDVSYTRSDPNESDFLATTETANLTSTAVVPEIGMLWPAGSTTETADGIIYQITPKILMLTAEQEVDEATGKPKKYFYGEGYDYCYSGIWTGSVHEWYTTPLLAALKEHQPTSTQVKQRALIRNYLIESTYEHYPHGQINYWGMHYRLTPSTGTAYMPSVCSITPSIGEVVQYTADKHPVRCVREL